MFEPTIRRMPRPNEMARLNTQELRDAFHVPGLFAQGELRGVFTDLDRLVVGGVVPWGEPVALPNHRETGRDFFLERRELGAINLGGPGLVHIEGRTFAPERLDCVYAPMGARSVVFESKDPANPAKFYLLSCPAHTAHPAAMIRPRDASPVQAGTAADSNQRTISKLIHPGGIQSCQLVMGLTSLAEGNVWNSFPPHTHWRRTEVYLYFDLGEKVLAHFMGEPHATRHLFVHNEEAVLSPAWSIHCGCGTGRYQFVWGMAGENQVFGDMDPVKPADLR